MGELLTEALAAGRPAAAEAAARREQLARDWGGETCYRPLLDWARAPRRAPDRKAGHLPDNPLIRWQRAALGEEGTPGDSAWGRDAAELVERLRGSRALEIYLRWHPETRALLDRLAKPR